MIEVPEVDDVDIAFGGGHVHMPSMEDIPEEFKQHNGTKWNGIVNDWFFYGLSPETEFHPKKGVDGEKAFRALSSIIGSFEPKHEHKEAAVAYLMSEWFKKVKNWKKEVKD